MTKKEVVFWILGLSLEIDNGKDDVENENIIDISETPKQKLFCNIQALILMCCTGFLWAFFNRFD